MKNSLQQTILFGLVSAVCLSVIPSLAHAEAGDGVKGENFQLKLSASAGTLVNSNLFYQENPVAPTALGLVLTPGLALSSVKTDRLALTLNWGLSWTQYLSDQEALRRQSGLSTDLGAAAHFNQGGNVSFRVEDNLQRTNDPPNGPSLNAINRFNNRLGGIVGIHPGGRALQGFLSYHWSTINFNNPDLNLSAANRDEHEMQGRFIWQFRPRFAALLTGNYTLVNYDEAERQVGGASLPNINSRPLRITAGVNGLILPNLSSELSAGYGRANYETGPSFSGIIGRASLGYYIGSNPDTKLTAAYSRTFSDAVIGSFVLVNRGDLRYTQAFMDKRLKLNIGAFYAHRTYEIIQVPPSPLLNATIQIPPQIVDNRVGGGAGFGYNFTKWLSLNAGYQLNANISDTNVTLLEVGDGVTSIAGRSYIQHIANASLTATY